MKSEKKSLFQNIKESIEQNLMLMQQHFNMTFEIYIKTREIDSQEDCINCGIDLCSIDSN